MAERKEGRNLEDRSDAPLVRRSERRFRALYDLAPIGIVLLDGETKILRGNNAFLSLVGDPQVRLTGQSLDSLVFAADRPAVRRILDNLYRHSGFERIDVRFGQAGDKTATLFIGADSEEDSSSKSATIYAIDTTEQKSLEQRLAQAQKMQAIGQLAGGIAHDFNNLLTAMIGYCDLTLLRQEQGSDDFSDIMQIKQNAERAATLVRQLLAFSRRQILQPHVLNVADTISGVTDLLRRLSGEEIKIDVQTASEPGLIFADESQLEQILVNLVVNARDAMPRGGRLSIRTATLVLNQPLVRGGEVVPSGNWVSIEVEDTGVGIPPEILSRIFEPFFSTKAIGQGTGLGLATVYGIVKQTGGYVFVDTAVGSGSVFRLLFPRHADASAAAESLERAKAKSTAKPLPGEAKEGENLTVLIVEDEDPVRLFAVRALQAKGYKVFHAGSGGEALEILRHERDAIDLLITDVVMPQMDGPSVIAAARAIVPEIKVLCMSGYAEEALKDRIRATQDVRFLSKPFSLAQFAGAVKEVLAPK